ncbi:Sas10 C-terminal domain-containing protein [Achaetomium macrosporum]|uniref:Sas10 C-terminal domain-containing protein n=1 Tax=Achaetomium macrosporum TaxID=79813 RepID=A0AAN7HDR5_9PEZI|nr:Sas10 C-terminal domain-containing protein [Achaetomium macrosporum]
MAKKRKAPRNPEPSGPREVDPKDARLTIKTYEDVADSEDEYWANQDRIGLDDDDEPRSKRLKRQEKEDAFLEASDEEILGEDESDESEEEEEEHVAAKRKGGKKAAARDEYASEEEEKGGEEEGDEGWWGSSKKEYYNADNIETEADALEEEAEARRLQAKKLAKMQEADFAFDESEWLAPKEQASEDQEVVTEVLKEVEVTDDMGPEERYKLLQARYPEFDYLVDEFRELQPVLPALQKEAEGRPAKSLEVIKSWLAGCYVAALASYFAILTSPSRDGDGSVATLTPSELRDHEVMETLMECREAWLKVKNLKSTASVAPSTGMLSPPEEGDLEMLDAMPLPKRKTEKLSKAEMKANKKKAAEEAKKAKAVEQSLAELSTLLKSTKKAGKAISAPAVSADVANDDNRSDFGEEEILDARTAADKARRKKTLKFYTSQIVQKANKRAGAGRDAGGDMDIPYRERLKDRQARLNAEAERRGKKGSKFGADLGGDDSDGDDDAVAKQVRGEEDEYYDMVAQSAQKKRADKAARYEALAQARKGERVVETEQLGPDGKRQITYQIQKNKGLTPHRKKEVRNPRVKKRLKFEEKQKKLKSIKAVYKGGEGRGGYQGELSGIKTDLVKSVKL